MVQDITNTVLVTNSKLHVLLAAAKLTDLEWWSMTLNGSGPFVAYFTKNAMFRNKYIKLV